MFQSDIDVVLLLTACVDPVGMEKTKLQNPEIRKKHYYDALDFYLKRTPYRIVVVENTNYDFSAPYQSYMTAGRLEYLKFDGNQYPREYGKGYGEAKILEYAFEHSVFLKNAPYVMKITGRYVIPHIKLLLRSTFALNIRKREIVAADMTKDLTSTWSICVLASGSFWKDYFLPYKDWINDSKNQYFEHALRQGIFRWIADHKYFQQYPLPVLHQGTSGTSGRKHQHSAKEYLIAGIKLSLVSWKIRKIAHREVKAGLKI